MGIKPTTSSKYASQLPRSLHHHHHLAFGMSGMTKVLPTQEELDAARAFQVASREYLLGLTALQAKYPEPELRNTDGLPEESILGDTTEMVLTYGAFNQATHNRIRMLAGMVAERTTRHKVATSPELGDYHKENPPSGFREASETEYPFLLEFDKSFGVRLGDAELRLSKMTKKREKRQKEELERFNKEQEVIYTEKAKVMRECEEVIRELEQSGATPTAEQIVQHMQAARAVAASAASTSRKAKTARAMKKVGGRSATKGSSSADRP